jgi:glucose/arabinose dehydrogenase
MSDHFHRSRAFALAGTCLLALALSGCNDSNGNFDTASQIGPDPALPEPRTELMPDLKIAEVVGWKDGQAPTVPEGLTVTAYARDLVNPRMVRTLPNGDVLVVQSRAPEGKPKSRPKDVIRDWVMAMAKGDTGPQKQSNLITLLRDTNRDGKVDERSDLLKGLNSPFGVVWHEGTLYVAAADAILAYPYQLGQTTITAEPKITGPRIWR